MIDPKRLDRNDPEDLERLVRFLFRLCLFIFWIGATIILLYENFKNGMPPEPAWWLAFEDAVGVTW
jgi:hypothetical protein